MPRSSHKQTADHHSYCIFGLLHGQDVWAFSLELYAWQVYKLETVTKDSDSNSKSFEISNQST